MSAAAIHQKPSIWTELNREWSWLTTRPHSHTAVHSWSQSWTVFRDAHTLNDIVDTVSQDSKRGLTALLTEHHNGHTLAARVLTQCMLPKLISIAPYARKTTREAGDSYFSEHAQITLAAFHRVLADWRPGNEVSAGNLGLNTLNYITKPTRSVPEIPVDPDSYTIAFDDRVVLSRDDLNGTAVLDWAAVNGHITQDEHALLTRTFIAPQSGGQKALAKAMKISDAALRKRVSRTVATLRHAVMDSIQANTFDVDTTDVRSLMTA